MKAFLFGTLCPTLHEDSGFSWRITNRNPGMHSVIRAIPSVVPILDSEFILIPILANLDHFPGVLLDSLFFHCKQLTYQNEQRKWMILGRVLCSSGCQHTWRASRAGFTGTLGSTTSGQHRYIYIYSHG